MCKNFNLCTVSYNNYFELEMFVLETGKPFRALISRRWLDVIKPSWRVSLLNSHNINNITTGKSFNLSNVPHEKI